MVGCVYTFFMTLREYEGLKGEMTANEKKREYCVLIILLPGHEVKCQLWFLSDGHTESGTH